MIQHPLEGAFYFILLNKKVKGYFKMKKIINSTVSVCLAIVFIFCLAACGNTVDKEGLWANATYLKDKEFGKGEKTAVVEVAVADQIVTFTVHTDKDTVGEALMEHDLISGDEGDYGLYVKKVNGITADYDVDQSYWAFYINGEYAMTGVDTTEIVEGDIYRLEYAR